MPISKFRHPRIQAASRQPIFSGHIPSSIQTAKETNITTVLEDATVSIGSPRSGLLLQV